MIKNIFILSDGVTTKYRDERRIEKFKKEQKTLYDKIENVRGLIQKKKYQDAINVFVEEPLYKKPDSFTIYQLLQNDAKLFFELLENYSDETVDLIMNKSGYMVTAGQFIADMVQISEGIPFAINIMRHLKEKFELGGGKKIGSYSLLDKKIVSVKEKDEQLYSEVIQDILGSLFYKRQKGEGASQEFYDAMMKEFKMDWVYWWEAKVLQSQVNDNIERIKSMIVRTNLQITPELPLKEEKLIAVPLEDWNKPDNREGELNKNLKDVKKDLDSLGSALRGKDEVFEIGELYKFAYRLDRLILWLADYRANSYIGGATFLQIL